MPETGGEQAAVDEDAAGAGGGRPKPSKALPETPGVEAARDFVKRRAPGVAFAHGSVRGCCEDE